jgi:hypothetical protein
MDMKVIQDDDEVTHVVLDGRFDIQGAQEVDSRFEELAKSSKDSHADVERQDTPSARRRNGGLRSQRER